MDALDQQLSDVLHARGHRVTSQRQLVCRECAKAQDVELAAQAGGCATRHAKVVVAGLCERCAAAR